jgi:hypothetical protein
MVMSPRRGVGAVGKWRAVATAKSHGGGGLLTHSGGHRDAPGPKLARVMNDAEADGLDPRHRLARCHASGSGSLPDGSFVLVLVEDR